MSLDKALVETGLQLNGDALSKEHRNVRTFKRLIAAIRAAEAAVHDDLSKSQGDLNDALRINLEQNEQIRILSAELSQLKLKTCVEGMDITSVNKQALLELSPVPAA